jgi:colicin import membrane protein
MSDVQIRPNTESYSKGVSGSGARTLHKGDDVGEGLNGMTVDEVKTVATKMGIEDVDKYDHLNVGQQRMNLGNRIRGAIARMDKAEEGAGTAKFDKAITPIRKVVDKRIEADAKAKEKAAAERAAKKEAKAA